MAVLRQCFGSAWALLKRYLNRFEQYFSSISAVLQKYFSTTHAVLKQYFGSAREPLEWYFSNTSAAVFRQCLGTTQQYVSSTVLVWIPGRYDFAISRFRDFAISRFGFRILDPESGQDTCHFRVFAISRFRDSVSGSWIRNLDRTHAIFAFSRFRDFAIRFPDPGSGNLDKAPDFSAIFRDFRIS